MGTSPKGLEALSLSHGAVFPAFLWIGKHCETSEMTLFHQKWPRAHIN